ncbi:hypothetical protein CRG98_031894 [Punica granatum]|uniref:Uncharacterized protein n=1 Tax=Punica granatum TaxID=22663 RepID=A0A2I0IUT2_PUNGR|nr:hypothetical protein CRG98_031894 [Punica granatum]
MDSTRLMEFGQMRIFVLLVVAISKLGVDPVILFRPVAPTTAGVLTSQPLSSLIISPLYSPFSALPANGFFSTRGGGGILLYSPVHRWTAESSVHRLSDLHLPELPYPSFPGASTVLAVGEGRIGGSRKLKLETVDLNLTGILDL